MSRRKFEMPGSRRRAVNLRLQPMLQLRLPLVVLAITALFGVGFAFHMDAAYGVLVKVGIEDPGIRALIEEQSRDFMVVSMAIGGAYVVAVLIACLAHGHRLLGPVSAIRRQIEGMKNGDYVSRLELRTGDPFSEVADDLNELATLLRIQEKRAE